MKKIKVTIFEYGQTRAVILNIYDWYNVMNDILNQGIQLDNVIKIERLMDAEDVNTEDRTQ